MRFTWTEEQDLLRSTLQKYVDTRYRFDYRRRRLAQGFDPEVWSELAQLGVLGLAFAEKYGGSAGSALDTLVVMEAFGRGLIIEPYIASTVLGGGKNCALVQPIRTDSSQKARTPMPEATAIPSSR